MDTGIDALKIASNKVVHKIGEVIGNNIGYAVAKSKDDEIVRSSFCDYSNVYIVAKGRKTVEEDNDDKTRNKKLIFKNNALSRSCISKSNNTFIDNAEYLDIVMPIYDLLEYGDNYSMTPGNLWSYYRNEVNDDANENNDDNDNKITTTKQQQVNL